jgi:putative hemolysin
MESAILFGLILINGFFAMSEISLVTARKARLQRLIDLGDRGAQVATQLGAEPTKFLSTIQIGITSVSMLSGIVGEATLAPPLEAWLMAKGMGLQAAGYLATGLVVALVTYFAIVVGELVPKRIGQMNAEGIARIVARPIQFLSLISKPFVLLLSGSTGFLLRVLGIDDTKRNAVTEEEIHAVLSEGSEAGAIEKEEHRMVRNLFRLDDLAVVSLMTPKADMVTLDVSASKEEVIALLESSPHSRYPVVRSGEDDIVGLASARDLLLRTLRGEPLNLESAARPPVFVPESVSGRDLLDSFRRSGDQLAFAINEYGTVLGLVTLHDVLEAITGAFKEASPDDERAVQREDGSWLFDGQLSLHELFDYLELREPPEDEDRDYQTLSGLIIHELGRLPRMSDRVSSYGWTFEVMDMDGHRVDRVLAAREAAQKAGAP